MSLRRSTGIAWPLQRFPVRAEFLPFALPEIDDAEIAEVVAVLKSGWLTTGPKVQQFEQAFSAFVGARFSVAVSSCTAALHLALEPAQQAESLALVSTVLGAGKDRLAQTWVSLATSTQAPALDMAALFRGTEGV